MKMEIGNEVITAKIKEREEAKTEFEEAKSEGKSAYSAGAAASQCIYHECGQCNARGYGAN